VEEYTRKTKMFFTFDESTVLLESAVCIVYLTHHVVSKLHQTREAGKSPLHWVSQNSAFAYVLMLKRETSTSVTVCFAVTFPHALTPRPGFGTDVYCQYLQTNIDISYNMSSI
jgi:beta-glucosidase/6-phospho-beta-glucosidase/beta-galactosidase